MGVTVIDIFDASQFMFAPTYDGTGRYVFFQNWKRKGFGVSAEERRRLANRLGPLLTMNAIVCIALIQLDDVLAARFGLANIWISLLILSGFFVVTVVGGSLIRRTVLGDRARTEKHVPYTQRCGADQMGKNLFKRTVPFVCILVGVSMAVSLVKDGKSAESMIGLGLLMLGLLLEALRYRKMFPSNA